MTQQPTPSLHLGDDEDYVVHENHSIGVVNPKSAMPDRGAAAVSELLALGEEKRSSHEEKTSATIAARPVHLKCNQFASQYGDNFYECAFPTLFAYGTGGPSEKRPIRLSKQALFRHYGELSSALFQGPWWTLHAYNSTARAHMSRVTHFQCRRKLEDFGRISTSEVKAISSYMTDTSTALNANKSMPDIESKYPSHIVSFVRSVRAVTRAAQHTREAIAYERPKLFSMMYAFGTPHLWYVFVHT